MRACTKAGLVAPEAMEAFTRLAACEYFAVDRFDLAEGAHIELGHADKLQILIGLSGEASLAAPSGEPVRIPRGAALVVPVGNGISTLHAHGAAEVIRVLQP